VVDIIDLAHYIVTGVPFGVEHAHQHGFPGQIAEIKVEPDSLQADALGGIFQNAFGFNPFTQQEHVCTEDCDPPEGEHAVPDEGDESHNG
jgi:hypothetical protein